MAEFPWEGDVHTSGSKCDPIQFTSPGSYDCGSPHDGPGPTLFFIQALTCTLPSLFAHLCRRTGGLPLIFRGASSRLTEAVWRVASPPVRDAHDRLKPVFLTGFSTSARSPLPQILGRLDPLQPLFREAGRICDLVTGFRNYCLRPFGRDSIL